ncbi:Extracellular protein SEL-1 and related proteins [Ceraceosorus bombacis]|uniref:Extracellular protein SEL-1 and related proteins n=1 Tax=Ceraceosorus bombacis TaxID=401625 RepID=A0A0P1B9S4_9BASI|nr:Extracellular protein SEL-1 and related proteins [Ceraceosorus bombacis]
MVGARSRPQRLERRQFPPDGAEHQSLVVHCHSIALRHTLRNHRPRPRIPLTPCAIVLLLCVIFGLIFGQVHANGNALAHDNRAAQLRSQSQSSSSSSNRQREIEELRSQSQSSSSSSNRQREIEEVRSAGVGDDKTGDRSAGGREGAQEEEQEALHAPPWLDLSPEQALRQALSLLDNTILPPTATRSTHTDTPSFSADADVRDEDDDDEEAPLRKSRKWFKRLLRRRAEGSSTSDSNDRVKHEAVHDASSPNALELVRAVWALLKRHTPVGSLVRFIDRLYNLQAASSIRLRARLKQLGFDIAPSTSSSSSSSSAWRRKSPMWEKVHVGSANGNDGSREQRTLLNGPLHIWPAWTLTGWQGASSGPFLFPNNRPREEERNTNLKAMRFRKKSYSDRLIHSFKERFGIADEGDVRRGTWTLTWRFGRPIDRKAREALEQRDKAMMLLEYAAGFRSANSTAEQSIDWQAMRHETSSPFSVLQQHFLGNATTVKGEELTLVDARARSDALFVLGQVSNYGLYGLSEQTDRAYVSFKKLVDLPDVWASDVSDSTSQAEKNAAVEFGSAPVSGPGRGNATASALLADIVGGAWSASGIALQAHGVETQKVQQDKALLHYHTAARAGDFAAQTTLGYRYHAGIGVPNDCAESLRWYEKAAEQAYQHFLTGPPGGLGLPIAKTRLSDLDGGAYGPGASAASTGLAARRPAMAAILHSLPSSDPNRIGDLLEYYTHHAFRGHTFYALKLAHIWYAGTVYASLGGAGAAASMQGAEGAGRVSRDYAKARMWALRVTQDVWPVDSRVVKRGGPAGYVASRGQKGEDVRLKHDDVRLAQAASAAAMMGKMFLRAEGTSQDFHRAWVWFRRATDLGDVEGYNGLGVMYRDGLGMPRDVKKAVEYFEAASNMGVASSQEGCVNLAQIHLDKHRLRVPAIGAQPSSANSASDRLALIQWTRSAAQDNVDALVKMGDYYFYGIGIQDAALLPTETTAAESEMTPSAISSADSSTNSRRRRSSSSSESKDASASSRAAFLSHPIQSPSAPSYEKAAACYAAAADRQSSALAYWNMGYLYESGLGVPRQDFHLAKRYYDMAVDRDGRRFDAAREEELDEMIEGALIVFGLAALAVLVYVRQGAAMRAERERREEEERRRNHRADGAPAPAPGLADTNDAAPLNRDDAVGVGVGVGGGGGGFLGNVGRGQPDLPFPWPPEGANVYAGL